MSRFVLTVGVFVLSIAGSGLLAPWPARAGEGEGQEKHWSDTAELSLVATGGNSESQTLGFKNLYKRAWDSSSIEITAAGIRAESTDIARTAFGDPNSFIVSTAKNTQITAENYVLKGRFNRRITHFFFWYAGGGWERNQLAGVNNRYSVAGGVGNIWRDTDDLKFRTDYALSYTDQEDVTDNPEADSGFLGVRFSWDYLNRWSGTTTYTNKLIIDESLAEPDDLRVDLLNAVSVTMSDRLALKVSLRVLFDNEPSFEEVALFDVPGPDGKKNDKMVLVQLDEVDTQLAVSLVVNF